MVGGPELKRLWESLLVLLAGLSCASAVVASTTVATMSPAVAFYYAANPPWDELQAFDIVVVDPDHVPDPNLPALTHTRLAAYVALGEAHPSRATTAIIPKAWLRGENKDWGSRLIDQSQADWPRFFTENMIAPLWKNGYRTFFLDTLDSYHLFAKTPEQRAVQEAGMVAVVNAVKARFPEVKLIFNRGFEILDRTHTDVEAVVAESLFQGYNASQAKFTVVSQADRNWLLGQLQRVRDEYRLPVIAIDYVPSSQRALARETARRIAELGIIAWVTTPDLGSLGVGDIEVMPRKVLVVHSTLSNEYQLRSQSAVRVLALPLNYLGLVPEYVDPRHLPSYPLAGRYAGVVVWLESELSDAESQDLASWVAQQAAQSVPSAIMGQIDFLFATPGGEFLGIKGSFLPGTTAPIEVVEQGSVMGFELAPKPTVDSFFALTASLSNPILTLRRGSNTQVAAALTPWGGYVVTPYAVVTLPGNSGDRWVIDPFLFLKKALRLPDMPVPDVSTETGRRMLMIHMDGDGFVSRTELPGNPLAGEAVRDRVVNKYPLPMTMSVIESEISPNGLYPALSVRAESIAKDIFRAPHVAIASHSYSHPFIWGKAGSADDGEAYNLTIPGYKFDLHREIEGSVRYIENRLAPPGKKVDMFLWTGACNPGSEPVAITRSLGVLNMNGGDTRATRTQPTVTRVEGLGMPLSGGFQVFAPNQNENVYTNNWQGPFYGYERVIETFEFTEKPRRLKPINIYFHAFITTKRAGMASLDKVFSYAMAQETTPVHISDYARKVLDFQRMAVARTPTGWRIRGSDQLRTLRLPVAMGFPDLQKSDRVAGYRAGLTESYVHLGNTAAELVLASEEVKGPALVSANARVEKSERLSDGWRWDLAGTVPLRFTLANAKSCRVRAGGRELTPARRDANLAFYEIQSHAARPLEAICRN